jgi:hypothetical protein
MTCLGDNMCHRSTAEELCRAQPDASPDEPDAQPDADIGPAVTPDAAGQLVISEILIDPDRTPEEPHEWFEVYNPSPDVTYDLMGMNVQDDSGDAFDIDVSLLIPPGEYAVFGENGDTAANGGVVVDFDYPDNMFDLGNSNDEVVIINPLNDVVIDRVAYGLSWDQESFALSLDPDSLDAVDNDSQTSWCNATTPFGDELPQDYGTPGTANPDC